MAHYKAWRLWDEGNSLKLLESALGNVSAKAEAERCIQVGLLCIQEEPDKRPSIASVLLMLNTQPITIPSPVRPPAFPYRLGKKAAPRESYSIQAECEITELNPR
ncbi:cysteine-rich receptor-like protein kinase 22 [Chenopodium quinoa]|uniref:cysteine-rich receptor-like protein kinase 22 n=1 Tax=Chenopodium quinoa TaxID=63459 RepID=UPI000B784C8F|nr:cysteine-rich receptor-like protein kinase 22 [Chenopodium quinoa]XP_021746897.1 cysteine-rich receptor-like protein kinase 22 [Chenopodium quinoa]